MSRIDSAHEEHLTQPEHVSRTDRLARWGLVACAAMLVGVALLILNARSSLQTRIATLEERTTQQLAGDVRSLQEQATKISSDLETATDRLEVTRKELESAREESNGLRQAQTRTARTAASNSQAVKNAKQETTAELTNVNARMADLTSDLKNTTSTLTSTRSELADHRRAITATTEKLSESVGRNAQAVSELQRRGQRQAIEFDLRKSSRPESWTVGDIRVQLRKADVRHGSYDVVLHVDDRQIERKDLTVNQPVPFLVGPDRERYELVVTAVEPDRIRGFLSVPKDSAISNAESQ